MNKKITYYRDGDCKVILVRRVVEDGEAVAEVWDYNKKKWVPSGAAWDVIDDYNGHWMLEEEDVEDYIRSMVERSPWIAEKSFDVMPDGARRILKK